MGELIAVLCREDLFKAHFQQPLHDAFPDGYREARTFLNRLADIRNLLSHADPISQHQAYRVFCYTSDIRESLRAYYTAMNQSREFNAPYFVSFQDSAGNRFTINDTRWRADLRATKFHVGDTIRLEVETTDPEHGTVDWVVNNIAHGESGSGNSFVLRLQPRHAGTEVAITATLKSSQAWHRHQNFDAMATVAYTVLPT